MISEDEENLFRESANDFVKLSLDCVDNQLINSIKSKASKFLEYLCDNIDGCSTLFTKVALKLLKNSVEGNSED